MGADPWAAFIQKLRQPGRSVEEVVAAEFRAAYGDDLGHVSRSFGCLKGSLCRWLHRRTSRA